MLFGLNKATKKPSWDSTQALHMIDRYFNTQLHPKIRVHLSITLLDHSLEEWGSFDF